MAGKPYQTRQKQWILDYLKDNAERAFTIDEITARINSGERKVGRTTVYRYIDRLLCDGNVRKFTDTSGKSATYQYVAHPTACERHMHLKCSRCGKFLHLNCKTMEQVNEHLLQEHHFCVDCSKSLLFGLCEDCMKEAQHGTD